MRLLIFVALLVMTSPAVSKVVSSSANALDISHGFETGMQPHRLYDLFGKPERWWNPAHSYSGDAQRLRMELKPGGCFCESLPNGGGVEHLRVSHVDPGKRITLSGALGPLLYEAAAGVMDIQIKPRAAGGSTLTMQFRAAGFAQGNAAKLAPAVDAVLREQMDRLFAASRRP